VKGYARASQHVSDLRDRAGGAEREPFAGHGGTILQAVEGLVIDRRFGLQIQNDNRHARALYERENGI